MSSPTDDELARWRAAIEAAQCSYVGRCNSGRCPKHSAETRIIARLLAEVARLRSLTMAVSIDRDTLEVERDRERTWSERIAHDLRALVAHAERSRGGMQVPWHHELANAARLPSVVAWARWHLARRDE